MMEEINETPVVIKQRHGCVTAWLILMIVANSAVALVYLFASEFITKNLPGEVSNLMIIILAVIGVANVIFAILLFQWKKIGFWGTIVTSIATFGININIGLGIGQSLFGLIGLGILFAVLQIKEKEVSAWQNLE